MKMYDKPELRADSCTVVRPQIAQYKEISDFVRDMLDYLRNLDKSFSVLEATRSLRRVSPALVSLLIKGKRKLSLDRVDEFAKLLRLNSTERHTLRSWVASQASGQGKSEDHRARSWMDPVQRSESRNEVGVSLLSDWLNVYVKDFFKIPAVQAQPQLLYKLLGHIAPPKRIDKSLKFLLREGYLRKTLEGRIVIESNLAVADPKVPSHKIRQSHKAALNLARLGIDLYDSKQRWANALVLHLNENSKAELVDLFQEFAEKLQDFAAAHSEEGDRLYQVLLNICPIGGAENE
jgi:uncharacterized protein (TIGR02147 family)